ncbi:hypothetical protein C8J56DRAFT_886165 [Mycena floridula]|nr:hypothetical protein C8J56DRAFT_886165 [Mycena floridula]
MQGQESTDPLHPLQSQSNVVKLVLSVPSLPVKPATKQDTGDQDDEKELEQNSKQGDEKKNEAIDVDEPEGEDKASPMISVGPAAVDNHDNTKTNKQPADEDDSTKPNPAADKASSSNAGATSSSHQLNNYAPKAGPDPKCAHLEPDHHLEPEIPMLRGYEVSNELFQMSNGDHRFADGHALVPNPIQHVSWDSEDKNVVLIKYVGDNGDELTQKLNLINLISKHAHINNHLYQ